MTKKIVAIGGGLLENFETLPIDKEIVRLAGKNNPVALFIPPQSRDVKKYWNIFQDVYGKRLGCKTILLELNSHNPPPEVIKEKILTADLIYVGGGNSLQMMRKWRRFGVDGFLRQAYDKGIVLSGISAGSICWFQYGLSNSMKYYNPEKWKYIRVKGLGLIPGTNSPHYNDEKRDTTFERLIKKNGGIGIALDTNAAFEIIDEKYRIITASGSAHAYKVYKVAGEIVTRKIKQSSVFTKVKELFHNTSYMLFFSGELDFNLLLLSGY